MNKYINRDARNKVWNYLRPWAYVTHPELKVGMPTQRWKILMTMRDLRLWILENAPHSNRALKHYNEVEHINKELGYLQFKGKIITSFSNDAANGFVDCWYYLLCLLGTTVH